MYLVIEDDKLLAIINRRRVIIGKVTTEDKVFATSDRYGVSVALAYEVLDTGLRINRLLRIREVNQ